METVFSKVKESLAKFDLETYNAMTEVKETLTDNLALIIMHNLPYFLPKYCGRTYQVSVAEVLEITQHVIRVEVGLNDDYFRELTIPVELITDEAKLKAVVAEKEKEKEQERLKAKEERRKAKEKQKADKEERDYALYLELKRKYEPESKSIGGQDDRI